MNWLSQIFAVALYNLRTIPERKGSAFTAAVGIAGVVLVLVGVLAIAAGFKKALTSSGAKDVKLQRRLTGIDEPILADACEEVRLAQHLGILCDGTSADDLQYHVGRAFEFDESFCISRDFQSHA